MKKKISYGLLLLLSIFLSIGQTTASPKTNQATSKTSELENLNLKFGIIGSTEWVGFTKYGLYSLNNGEITLEKEIPSFKLWDGFYRDGKYYSICFDIVGSRMIYYRTYNAEIWEVENEVLTITTDQPNYMSFDPETGNIYAITLTSGSNFKTLSKVDLKTGKATKVKDLANLYRAFEFDGEGQAYGITQTGDLYKIDKHTGVEVIIGATGLTPKDQNSGTHFDSKTNTLYWSVCTTNGKAGLYTVNLSTGVATNIVEFANNEQVTGLFVIDEFAEGAPAPASNLQFVTEGASLTGKIKFIVPSTTIDGTPLSGTLDGKIVIGGQESITLTGLTPGSIYESNNVTFKTSGNCLVTVTFHNAVGQGANASKVFWAGADTPLPVTNLVLAENAGKAQLTWDAPEGGVNGGYVDPLQLKYKITRIIDTEEVVEDAFTGTTYTDLTLPEPLNVYKYTVTPYYENLYGEVVTSNEIILGKAFTIPYDGSFTTTSSKLWTLKNYKDTKSGWKYSNNEYTISPASLEDADDWLTSPPIQLKPGAMYKLTYDLRSYNAYYFGSMKVYWGKSQERSNQTEIADYPALKTSTTYRKEEALVIIPDGDVTEYYISFQACNTIALRGGLRVKNVKLELLSEVGSPNVVENLSIKAGANGAPLVDFRFNLPTKNIGGSALVDPVTNIEIYRNNEANPIAQLNPPFNGELTYQDASPNNGMNTYKIVASNSIGGGIAVIDSLFVGHDIPAVVEDVSYTKEGLIAVLSWSAPSIGVHGGYIDPATLTYTITRNDGTVVGENITNASLRDETIENIQAFVSYTIVASATGGKGVAVTTERLRFGDAYSLPFAESFADMAYQEKGWYDQDVVASTSTNQRWMPASSSIDEKTVASVDNDNGFLVCNINSFSTGFVSRLISPTLDLTTITNPKLGFWMYHYFNNYSRGEKIEVEVSVNDGDFVTVTTTPILLDNGTTGWAYYEYLLTDYKESDNFRFAFKGSAISSGGNEMFIDNVQLLGAKSYDLVVNSIITPEFVFAGTPSTLKVVIANGGVESVSDYTISVMEGEEILATVNNLTLARAKKDTVDVIFTPSLNKVLGTYSIRAEAKHSADEDLTNNISEIVNLQVAKPSLPIVEELIGWDEAGDVILEWDAVDNANNPVYVLDNFDTYDRFVIEGFGPWSIVDRDGLHTYYTYDIEVPYENRGLPMAYQVYDAKYLDPIGMYGYSTHSGEKSLLCPLVLGSGKTNDDWLISEELCGAEQIVTFYVSSVSGSSASLSQFIVHYSTTTNDVAEFKPLGVAMEAPEEWTKVSFTLPKGAKHFAIQTVKVGGTGLMIDDIGYVKTGGAATLLGYNVYRDGIKINDNFITELTFTDSNPKAGDNEYHVTAVFDSGESFYSEAITVAPSSGLDSETVNYKVYSSQGSIIITGVNNSKISVASLGGVIIHQEKGTNYNAIPVEKGFYLVTIKGKTTKVIVK